jgi:glycosyltransferase involved in cell wall biosynthesis
MSCGLSVIGTRVAGIEDILTHEETGYLCNTDPLSLAAAIQQVMDQSGLREHLGANARRLIETQYSLSHVLDLEEAVLREAIQDSFVDVSHK